MDSFRNFWKRWKNRREPPTTQMDSSSSNVSAMGLKPSDFTVDFISNGRAPLPMSNDDSVTVGKAHQNVALIKRSHSFQDRTRSNSVSSMVRAHQTSTLNPKDFILRVEVEEAEEAREQPRIRSRSVAIPRIESTEATHQRQSQQPSVNHQVNLDGMSTCRLLVKLLQTGSEKLNFTPQALELLREYVWLLEMFPNNTHLREKLKVNRSAVVMTPPPPPRINVFAHPDLLALIKMDDQENWLIDSNTLSLLLYFLYRQKVKPMLEQEDQERQELERLRTARRAHGN